MSELTPVKVLESLSQFGAGVHDERPLCCNGFEDGFAAENEHHCVFEGRYAKMFAVGVEEDEVVGGYFFAPIDANAALYHEQGRIVIIREREFGSSAGLKVGVEQVYGGESGGCSCDTLIISCDDLDVSAAIGQRVAADLIAGDALIFWGRHFVAGRKIDPQLHHLEIAAGGAKRLFVIFLVENAGCGSHPLHLALADDAAVARAVVVRHAAFVGDGDGFEASVRVNADAARFIGGWEVEFGIVVEHDERTHAFHVEAVGAGYEIVYAEAVAHKVRGGRGHDQFYVFGCHWVNIK